jgi:hypothetical protein
MIEETARHAGHIDIIREMLDGMTGDHQDLNGADHGGEFPGGVVGLSSRTR